MSEEIKSVYGIGPQQATELVDQGVTNIAQLRKRSNKLTRTQQLGLKYHSQIRRPIPIDEVPKHIAMMKRLIPVEKWGRVAIVAGSYRRKTDRMLRKFRAPTAPTPSKSIVGNETCDEQHVNDIDIIITAPVSSWLAYLMLPPRPGVSQPDQPEPYWLATLARSDDKWSGIVKLPGAGQVARRVDVLRARPSPWGYAFMLLYFTGSSRFNIKLRAHAKRNGMRLDQTGLYDAKSGKPHPELGGVRNEKDVFRLLGLKYVPPGLRG